MAEVVWEEVDQEGAAMEMRLYAAPKSPEAGWLNYTAVTKVIKSFLPNPNHKWE